MDVKMYPYYYIVNEEMTQILLFDLYEAWNKPEKAKKWRAKLQQAEAVTE
jgi:hypothetical protein